MRLAKVKINVFLVIYILKLRSPNITSEHCYQQMATLSSQVPTQELLIAFNAPAERLSREPVVPPLL